MITDRANEVAAGERQDAGVSEMRRVATARHRARFTNAPIDEIRFQDAVQTPVEHGFAHLR
ncbi:hypothetical protein AB5J72_09420 [Streptomyces sp. CG1]|uniref:hypothetical protein n=1 Tax=Streptomyces sp. CG1 TaxID=1287523 RepID=UPI0034E270F5